MNMDLALKLLKINAIFTCTVLLNIKWLCTMLPNTKWLSINIQNSNLKLKLPPIETATFWNKSIQTVWIKWTCDPSLCTLERARLWNGFSILRKKLRQQEQYWSFLGPSSKRDILYGWTITTTLHIWLNSWNHVISIIWEHWN